MEDLPTPLSPRKTNLVEMNISSSTPEDSRGFEREEEVLSSLESESIVEVVLDLALCFARKSDSPDNFLKNFYNCSI